MPIALAAQEPGAPDSVRKENLSSVTITAFHYVQDIEEFDADALRFSAGSSTAGLVQENSGIYLKSYGASGLATLSIHGLGAEHAKIYWNGMELNSGMNGTIDLQTMPVFLLDNIGLAPGSGAMELGSGTFGGALAAYTTTNFHTPLQVRLLGEGGSFGNVNTGVTVSGSRINTLQKRWYQNASVIFRRKTNNYSFSNTAAAGNPEQELPNAAFTQYGGSYTFATNGGFKFVNLTTYTDRELPPTMLNLTLREYQQDWLSLHSLECRKGPFKVQAGYKYDYISYQQPQADINSPSHTHTAFALFEYNNFIKQMVEYGIQLSHRSLFAKNESLDGRIYRPVTGLYAYAEYDIQHKWIPRIVLRLRQELVGDKFQPFQPSVTLWRHFFSRWKLSVTVQRQYKYPTINEQYWEPGGNPDLLAEKGLNLEVLNELVAYNKHGHVLKLSATAYYMSINNWILWQPTGFGYWAPMNVKKVVSRGIDTKVEYSFTHEDWKLKATVNYQFCKATNQETTNSNDESNGKILIYSPQHVVNGSVYVEYKGWYLYYNQNFTGPRFTTSDNSQQLDAFTTADATVGKIINLKQHQLELYFRVENMGDAEYQNIAWRPMPGRSFNGGLTYTFKKQQP